MNNPLIPKPEKGKPIGKWQKECDTLMQEIGRLTNPACILCGKECQVQHHFVPKSVSARLRYEWINLIPLCNGCHHRLHQSGDPDYEQRIIKFYGQKWYNKLQEMRKESIRVNIGYYQKIKSSFVELRDEIKGTNFSPDW